VNSVVYFTIIAVLTTKACVHSHRVRNIIQYSVWPCCHHEHCTWQETIMATQSGAMVSIQYCLISLYGVNNIILIDIME